MTKYLLKTLASRFSRFCNVEKNQGSIRSPLCFHRIDSARARSHTYQILQSLVVDGYRSIVIDNNDQRVVLLLGHTVLGLDDVRARHPVSLTSKRNSGLFGRYSEVIARVISREGAAREEETQSGTVNRGYDYLIRARARARARKEKLRSWDRRKFRRVVSRRTHISVERAGGCVDVPSPHKSPQPQPVTTTTIVAKRPHNTTVYPAC